MYVYNYYNLHIIHVLLTYYYLKRPPAMVGAPSKGKTLWVQSPRCLGTRTYTHYLPLLCNCTLKDRQQWWAPLPRGKHCGFKALGALERVLTPIIYRYYIILIIYMYPDGLPGRLKRYTRPVPVEPFGRY